MLWLIDSRAKENISVLMSYLKSLFFNQSESGLWIVFSLTPCVYSSILYLTASFCFHFDSCCVYICVCMGMYIYKEIKLVNTCAVSLDYHIINMQFFK